MSSLYIHQMSLSSPLNHNATGGCPPITERNIAGLCPTLIWFNIITISSSENSWQEMTSMVWNSSLNCLHAGSGRHLSAVYIQFCSGKLTGCIFYCSSNFLPHIGQNSISKYPLAIKFLSQIMIDGLSPSWRYTLQSFNFVSATHGLIFNGSPIVMPLALWNLLQ